jgi:dihydroxy-acid dehydratase
MSKSIINISKLCKNSKFHQYRSLNNFSNVITGDITNGASRAMLYSLNLTEKDLKKPFICVGSMNYDSNPCNNHLQELSDIVKKSLIKENLNGFTYNTIGISDGITMGTKGMSYSLPSREIIADSIETFMKGHYFDGGVCIPGCDKNLPGSLMGLIRVNRPSFIIYGGSIKPGTYNNNDVDVVTAFQSYGELKNNNISQIERESLLKVCCNGSGSCGGMYTANTMAVAIEAMGMCLPYSSSNLRETNNKIDECKNSGIVMLNLLKNNIKPLDIITKDSLKNSIKMIIAMGGSTNAVLHLLAIARTANIKLDISEFNYIGRNVPVIANMKPFGKYLMKDIYEFGGTPLIMKLMIENDILNGDCLTITGKSLKDNLAHIDPNIIDRRKDIISFSNPIKKDSHIRIFKGNIAPGGAVGKITGKEGSFFKGRAIVFDSEEDFIKIFSDIEDNNILKNKFRNKVIVIRNQGPKGGPGMPEMLKATSLINGIDLSDKVAFITDGRFSGGSHGFIIGHITPEAYDNGIISIVKNGDIIKIDAKKNRIQLRVSRKLIQKRFINKNKKDKITSRKNDEQKYTYLEKYTKLVKSASSGCVTY